jgi:hypothetical protein
MRARHGAQRAVNCEIGEGDEFRDIDFVSAARFRVGDVGDVGEPFQLGRNINQSLYCFGVSVRSLLILTSSFATSCPLLVFLTR